MPSPPFVTLACLSFFIVFAPHNCCVGLPISYVDGLIPLLDRFILDPNAMTNVTSVIPGRIYVVKGEHGPIIHVDGLGRREDAAIFYLRSAVAYTGACACSPNSLGKRSGSDLPPAAAAPGVPKNEARWEVASPMLGCWQFLFAAWWHSVSWWFRFGVVRFPCSCSSNLAGK